MKLRKFVGPTVAAALRRVKEALGEDAMILETRTAGETGTGVEVTAAVDDDPVLRAAVPGADAALLGAMRELSGLVRALVGQSGGGAVGDLGPELSRLYGSLVCHGIDGRIAASLIGEAARHMAGGVSLENAVAAAVDGAMRFDRGEDTAPSTPKQAKMPRVRLFCGPPGDGKTTTIAKLAGRLCLSGRRRVALVSTDTYRMGGAEELGGYARILGVPLARASSPDDLRETVERFANVDDILVDTAGVSVGDDNRRAEIVTLADAVPVAHVTLVVSAMTAPAVTRRVWARLRSLQPQTCIVTKVDAAPAIGALEALWRQQLPLAFFGTGRRVPQDLEEASAENLAARLLAA